MKKELKVLLIKLENNNCELLEKLKSFKEGKEAYDFALIIVWYLQSIN